MADILISKFTTQIPRVGATPATPGFAESEGQDPVSPSGTPQVYTPVTIGSPANGLSISGTQVLTIGLASTSTTGALSGTDWNTFNNKLNLTSAITGYTVGANTALADTDTILQAFGKVQGQINARISGTIASGQVAFGTGVNTVGGSNNLFWDNANGRLLIGTNVSEAGKFLDVIFNEATLGGRGIRLRNINSTGYSEVVFDNDTAPNGAGGFVFGFAGTGTSDSNNGYFFNRRNASILFGTNNTERWRVTATGILQSVAAQTIQTGTGTLTIATAAGNGNILINPHGSGRIGLDNTSPLARLHIGGELPVSSGNGTLSAEKTYTNSGESWGLGIDTYIFNSSPFYRITDFVGFGETQAAGRGSIMRWFTQTNVSNGVPSEFMRISIDQRLGILTTSPTNTLDVNGTARIRNISNLGSAATSILVPSATGVVSLRTLAELASDLGAVTITGTQTITGAKTFNNSLLVQSGSNPVFRIATTDNTAIVNFRNVLNEDAAGIEMSTPSNELAIVTRVSNKDIRIQPNGTGKIKLPNVPTGTGDVLGRDASNNLVRITTLSSYKLLDEDITPTAFTSTTFASILTGGILGTNSFNGATDASFEGNIFIRSTSSGSYNFDLRFNIWSQNIDTALTIGAITGDIIHKVTFKLIIQGGSFLITGLTQFAESAFTYGFEINPAMTTYTATGTSALGIQAKVSGTGSPTLYMTSFVLKQIA